METTKVRAFINRNLSAEPYELMRYYLVQIYPDRAIDWEKVPETIIKRAENDLQLFADLQAKRDQITVPIVGDCIIRKDGRRTYIGIFSGNGDFQDTEGGSFCMSKSGRSSYSGGFTMDVLNTSNLVDTGDKTPLFSWIFSGDLMGGNRGVYDYVNVRVWREI